MVRELDDYAFTQIGFQKSDNAEDIVAVKPMPAESQASVHLQIGYVLFMDLVGYSTVLKLRNPRACRR